MNDLEKFIEDSAVLSPSAIPETAKNKKCNETACISDLPVSLNPKIPIVITKYPS